MLVRSWEDMNGSDTKAQVHRLLGKKTLASSRDTLIRAFIPRFISGDPPDAWKILRLIEKIICHCTRVG